MKKKDFKEAVADVVIEAIYNHRNIARSTETKITTRANALYVRFHRYGDDLYTYIYPDGNIELKFKEFINGEHICKYYIFDESDKHEDLLEVIKKDFDMLIGDFYYGMSYHELVVWGIEISLKRDKENWETEYKEIKKATGQFPEGE